jgi:hypothetical protein
MQQGWVWGVGGRLAPDGGGVSSALSLLPPGEPRPTKQGVCSAEASHQAKETWVQLSKMRGPPECLSQGWEDSQIGSQGVQSWPEMGRRKGQGGLITSKKLLIQCRNDFVWGANEKSGRIPHSRHRLPGKLSQPIVPCVGSGDLKMGKRDPLHPLGLQVDSPPFPNFVLGSPESCPGTCRFHGK